MLASGEFAVDPVGTVLQPTAFPPPGERGGPTMAITVRNITGSAQRISIRLQAVAPELDRVATVRGSVAGAVVLHGTLGSTTDWSTPAGLLPSGATSTLRIRFKLRRGVDADQFAGRLDIRQLELKGAKPGEALEAPSDVQKVVPGTVGTSPVTPMPTSPSGGGAGTTPAQGLGTSATPRAAPAITPRSSDAPRRRAPDEGSE